MKRRIIFLVMNIHKCTKIFGEDVKVASLCVCVVCNDLCCFACLFALLMSTVSVSAFDFTWFQIRR